MTDEKNNELISYVAHESDMARMEQIIGRMWIALIICIISLIGTNLAWVLYEMQYQVVEVTQEVEQDADGDSVNHFIGGDYYGSTPESDYTDKN